MRGTGTKPSADVNDTLFRRLGWVAALLPGDPSIFDRWWWLRSRLRRGSATTLEAGSGSGAFSLYAARLGNPTVGVSFDDRNNAVARKRASILGLDNVRFVTADLREIDRLVDELGTFDQIICCETIEHIVDDQRVVSGLAQMLSPGGRLLITTPSEAHRRYYRERLPGAEDGGHVRYGYTHDDLSRLFRHAGLDATELGYVTGVLSQAIIHAYARVATVSLVLAWLLSLPFRPLQTLDPLVSKLSRYPRYCVTAVATKPADGHESNGQGLNVVGPTGER